MALEAGKKAIYSIRGYSARTTDVVVGLIRMNPSGWWRIRLPNKKEKSVRPDSLKEIK